MSKHSNSLWNVQLYACLETPRDRSHNPNISPFAQWIYAPVVTLVLLFANSFAYFLIVFLQTGIENFHLVY
jgi:hypothetical protein